jgi:phospholipid/cholesterol/gamma-HCH transport system permease protein
LRRLPARVGAAALQGAQALGALGMVAARTALALPRLERRELARGLVDFGHGSLGLAMITAAIAGATVVAQTSLYVQRFGTRSILGWAAGYAVLWEFGPLLLGLLMAARLGARNAAELATLSTGGQLEGLRGISLDPFALLVAPRVVAMVASVTALSALAFLVAVLFEAFAALVLLALPLRSFFGSFADMLRPVDLLGGVLKASSFGVAIALVSTAVGLRAQGGARAVGQSAASAVVLSCASIFLLDFLLTLALAGLAG